MSYYKYKWKYPNLKKCFLYLFIKLNRPGPLVLTTTIQILYKDYNTLITKSMNPKSINFLAYF